MLGGNIMNDKSKDLLKKMCFILKVVRWVCLISVVLLIGLSLFYAFNKDVYNMLFGSIRIDYLQLIFNDDLALNKDKNLKLYFSISEVAQMFDVNESTLRFWEKEFDQIRPRKTGKGTRSYRQEDIDAIRLVYHLVKERGMTLAGARQKLKENPETTIRHEEIVNRLKQIKEELLAMKEAFEALEASK